jgi:large subunit ribosomal protein L19
MANQAKIGEVIFSVGDKVKVYQKIQEGDKIRTQPFEGIVISIKGSGENKMFTVRKIAADGIGVERIWPLNSPWIEKIKVLRKGKVRRAKLYYLRKQPTKLKFISSEARNKVLRRKSEVLIHETAKPRKAGRRPRGKTSEKKQVSDS